MPQRGLHHHFLKYSAVVQMDGQGVGNVSEGLVVVVLRELRVLDALDACAEGLHKGGGSGLGAVGVVGCVEAVEDEHGGDHVLDAVVAVGEVVHGLELLVNDADAGFVCADCDVLDVFGGFTPFFKLSMDMFRGFNGGLGVEFRWGVM